MQLSRNGRGRWPCIQWHLGFYGVIDKCTPGCCLQYTAVCLCYKYPCPGPAPFSFSLFITSINDCCLFLSKYLAWLLTSFFLNKYYSSLGSGTWKIILKDTSWLSVEQSVSNYALAWSPRWCPQMSYFVQTAARNPKIICLPSHNTKKSNKSSQF